MLTKEYLARLETLNLNIAAAANTAFAGARKSGAKGSSLEFADFRDYSPGDDPRRIDWNSYGRLDKLFIKLFTEEKQAAVNIFLDASASMDYGDSGDSGDFGKPNKFVFAKLVAASVAYLAMKNADRANVFCCGSRLSVSKTDMSTKNSFSALAAFLEDLRPEGPTMLCRAVEEASRERLGQGVSFIISDLFSEDGFQDAVKILQNRKQRVAVVHVLDEDEYAPDAARLPGALHLIDSESGDFLDVYADAGALKAYRAAFTAFQNRIRAFCEGRNASYTFAPTGSNVIKLLGSIQ